MIWIAYASMWVSTATAATFGIYYTGSPSCLWALLIPALVGFQRKKDEGAG